MRQTKRMRKTRKNRKSRGGLFGPSASDKYVDELLANINDNSKIEKILERLYNYLQRSMIPKLKEKARGQNIEYVTQRINAIVTERESNEIQ
jgi:hypothetical protein